MEYLFTTAVWGVLIAAPCAFGILLGCCIRARRTSWTNGWTAGGMPSSSYACDAADAVEPLVVEAWRLPGKSTPRDAKLPGKARPCDARAHRKSALAGMPPLNELRAQTQAAKAAEATDALTVWEDPELSDKRRAPEPIAARVLNLYQDVAHPLRDAGNAKPVTDNDGWIYLSDAVPRIAAAAPVELSKRVDELMKERAEQAKAANLRIAVDQPFVSSALTRV